MSYRLSTIFLEISKSSIHSWDKLPRSCFCLLAAIIYGCLGINREKHRVICCFCEAGESVTEHVFQHLQPECAKRWPGHIGGRHPRICFLLPLNLPRLAAACFLCKTWRGVWRVRSLASCSGASNICSQTHVCIAGSSGRTPKADMMKANKRMIGKTGMSLTSHTKCP